MPLGMLGKYERIDVLGHGVSGIVYLAKDTLLNKQIALKEVDVQAGDLQRFLEEARVMDRLRHPNIVRVNGVDRIGNKVVIDMEYVRGENLQEKLRGEGRLALERALDHAIQILDALDYAHSMQTVHRDIKPANILITREGQVKIVDFGLAEILSTNAYAGGAGTYAYMAPEDFAEEDRSDHQSDIWAVGVTLFEMLTGHRPFQVEKGKVKDPFAWKRLLENESPERLESFLPRVAPELQAILDRALTKNKAKRYARAGDFRDDLKRFREGEAIEAVTLQVAKEMEEQEQIPALEWDLKTLPVQTEKGTMVAQVPPLPTNVANEQESAPPVAKKLFQRKEVAPQLIVAPEQVLFGQVHQGDLKSKKVRVKVKGVRGAVIGSVEQKPEWLTVHPRAFENPNQTITLTVHSGRFGQLGTFNDTVTVVTEAGKTRLPLRVEVIRARLTLSQVGLWYVPLLLLALAPSFLVSMAGGRGGGSWLLPPSLASTAFMCLMLLLICRGADTQIGIRLLPGLLSGVSFMVLGAMIATNSSQLFQYGHRYLVVMGFVFVVLTFLQVLRGAQWKKWAFVLFCMGVGVCSMIWNLLPHA